MSFWVSSSTNRQWMICRSRSSSSAIIGARAWKSSTRARAASSVPMKSARADSPSSLPLMAASREAEL
ncbi:hypothetical protein STENM223S_07150 [Streptomyces tendae]